MKETKDEPGQDHAEVERLVTDNIKLAQFFANQWAPLYGWNEALSSAMEGLWRAAKNFDPLKGVPFGSYASMRIKWYMAVPLVKMNKRKRGGGTAIHVHLDQLAGESGSTTTGEAIEDERQRPACDVVGDDDEHALLASAMASISDRERDVLRRRYGIDRDEETLDSVAVSYGITRERIRQIEGEAEEKLRVVVRRLREGLPADRVRRAWKPQEAARTRPRPA